MYARSVSGAVGLKKRPPCGSGGREQRHGRAQEERGEDAEPRAHAPWGPLGEQAGVAGREPLGGERRPGVRLEPLLERGPAAGSGGAVDVVVLVERLEEAGQRGWASVAVGHQRRHSAAGSPPPMSRESNAASAAESIGPGSWRFQRLLVMRWRSPR